MPTYEYECKECKHQFEVFQSIKDDPIKVCEKCGKEVRKLFSSAGVIFKGSGFYVNDYKNSDKSASAPVGGGCASGNCPVESCPAKAGE